MEMATFGDNDDVKGILTETQERVQRLLPPQG